MSDKNSKEHHLMPLIAPCFNFNFLVEDAHCHTFQLENLTQMFEKILGTCSQPSCWRFLLVGKWLWPQRSFFCCCFQCLGEMVEGVELLLALPFSINDIFLRRHHDRKVESLVWGPFELWWIVWQQACFYKLYFLGDTLPFDPKTFILMLRDLFWQVQ